MALATRASVSVKACAPARAVRPVAVRPMAALNQQQAVKVAGAGLATVALAAAFAAALLRHTTSSPQWPAPLRVTPSCHHHGHPPCWCHSPAWCCQLSPWQACSSTSRRRRNCIQSLASSTNTHLSAHVGGQQPVARYKGITWVHQRRRSTSSKAKQQCSLSSELQQPTLSTKDTLQHFLPLSFWCMALCNTAK